MQKALKAPGFFRDCRKKTGRRKKKAKNKEDNEETDSPGLLELADQLTKGQELPVNGYSLKKEGSTKPPKRYTSGSMVLAMENAGQLIEDEELRAQIKGSGIGTSATRAEIIKKLVRIGYLHLNKKITDSVAGGVGRDGL